LIVFEKLDNGYRVTYNDIFICYTSHPKKKLVQQYAEKRGYKTIKELYERNKFLLGDEE